MTSDNAFHLPAGRWNASVRRLSTHTPRVGEISRDLADLAAQAIGRHHQYPDGPVHRDHVRARGRSWRSRQRIHAQGGEVVRISAPELGTLVNEVVFCDQAEPWTFGTGAPDGEPGVPGIAGDVDNGSAPSGLGMWKMRNGA